MKKRLIAIGSALTASSLNLVALLPASAQIRPIDALQPIQPRLTQVDASSIRLNKRAPLRFEAFEMKDPETGKPISADTVLTTPDGNQVKAGEYYAELNRFEQEFSGLGYSLRQPEENVLLQESVIDQGELNQQVDAASKAHFRLAPEQTLFRTTLDPEKAVVNLQQAPTIRLKPGALQHLRVSPQLDPPVFKGTDLRSTAPLASVALIPDSLSSLQLNHDLVKSASSSTIPIIPKVIPAKTFTRSWNSGLIGSKGTFGADASTKLQITGHPTYTSAYAEGNANGYIFNNQVSLLRAQAQLNSQKSGNANVSLQLNALGQTVYNFQDSKNTLLVKGDSFTKTHDQVIADVRFTIGPIPMHAKFGVKGTVGTSYYVVANPGGGNVYAKVNPFIDTRAYGQGGADIVVGGAGVGANLLLLRDDLDIRGMASVGLENNKPYLLTQLSAYNELQALNGNAYAYAYIYVPRWGVPPWKKKQWDWNILNWSGLNTSGYLFDESHKEFF